MTRKMTLQEAVDVLNEHGHNDQAGWVIRMWMKVDADEYFWAYDPSYDRGLYPFEAVAIAEKYLGPARMAAR